MGFAPLCGQTLLSHWCFTLLRWVSWRMDITDVRNNNQCVCYCFENSKHPQTSSKLLKQQNSPTGVEGANAPQLFIFHYSFSSRECLCLYKMYGAIHSTVDRRTVRAVSHAVQFLICNIGRFNMLQLFRKNFLRIVLPYPPVLSFKIFPENEVYFYHRRCCFIFG